MHYKNTFSFSLLTLYNIQKVLLIITISTFQSSSLYSKVVFIPKVVVKILVVMDMGAYPIF